MTINTKIQPLVEDLGNILPGVFLKTTEFKRWLVERGLDEVWAQFLQYIKSNRSFFATGYDYESADAEDALGYLVNIIFEQKRANLPPFLQDILSFYADEKSEYIDATNIKKDLFAAGYTKEEVIVLDGISIPKPVEDKIDEELTQEQKVRSLEQAYQAQKEENSYTAIDAYLEWHSAALLYLSNYYTEANPDYAEFKHLDNSGNGHGLRHNFKSIYSIYNLLMNNVTKQEIAKTITNAKKTPLVFISHTHEDKDFVVALVNLLEDMGFTKNTLFCSSVREYGIPLSDDIFETIRGLFLKHDLYVIFVHSPRFYGSAVSLNEMGAAWVLKTGFCSLLTCDMEYPEYKKLQIAKMRAGAESRQKAIIRGNIVKGYKGSASTLKIFNAGAVTARNVRVEWLNESSDVSVRGDFSEIGELTPQNSRSYKLYLIEGHTETMNLRYSWDDDFATGNQLEESLQL